MRTLYLDCGMGAAGDMLTAALLELFPNPKELVEEMNALGIPGVRYTREASVKCGITGTHVTVKADGAEEESLDVNLHHTHHTHHEPSHEHPHHSHSSLHEIGHIVREHLQLPEQVRDDIMAVYQMIAEA